LLTITVSQLNRYLKAVLEENDKLRDLYVRGEVADFIRHGRSGHCYFRLIDEGGMVKAVIFRQNAELLSFEPQDGMAVLARCSLGVYERDGAYQIYVTELMPVGQGEQAVALAQRKARLEKLGAFNPELKKPLPAYAKRIGVVTSPVGAALQDIITVLERRWPLATLVLAPALVQGEQAAASICYALEKLDGSECDLIILSRGGGSSEDLSAFNDEQVVLSVFKCKTPIICAVGHQTDYTLCDHAADARAPTPSAAAEQATPDIEELARHISAHRERLSRQANRLLAQRRSALERVSAHPAMRSPANAVNKCRERLDIHTKTLYNSSRIIMQRQGARLSERAARLDALSPLGVLQRGYCLAVKDGRVCCAAGLKPGDELGLRFHDGRVKAKVLETERGSR